MCLSGHCHWKASGRFFFFFLKGRTCFSLLLSKMVRIHKAGKGIVCGRNKCERKKQGREERKNPARKKDKGECIGGGVGRGPLTCQPLPPTSSMSGNLVWISLETPIPYAPAPDICEQQGSGNSLNSLGAVECWGSSTLRNSPELEGAEPEEAGRESVDATGGPQAQR